MSAIAPLLVVLGGLAGATPGQAASSRQHGPPSDYHAQPTDRENDRDGRGNERGGEREEQQARVSLDDAVAIVRARYQGKVIRAETHYSDGRPVHHIRILTPEGRVYTVRVDGVSGRTQ